MKLVERIAQEFNDVRKYTGLNSLAPYTLLQGNLALDNFVITKGMDTTLYTGNGGAQSVVTGIDMKSNIASIDSLTLWTTGTYNTGDERYILDTSSRKIRVVCLKDGVTSNPNTLLTFTDDTFSDWKIESQTNGGMYWLKGRSAATANYLVDTTRGATKDIYSNATTAETTQATGLTAFTSTGFTLGALAGMNTNLATYVAWGHQTTHMISGLTNHNKPYITEYNPFSGYTQTKYKGSGIAGHEIPHHLGRKLGFVTVKNLSSVISWQAQYTENTGVLALNASDAQLSTATNIITNFNDTNIITNAGSAINASTNQHILYGWANSYFDETNKLIGNYEVGIYQGTGVAGNKVTTRGKPAWVMIKRLDGSSGYWYITDNKRLEDGNGYEYFLYPNSTSAEASTSSLNTNLVSDGFIQDGTGGDINASGGQYLYMIVYDTNSNGGGTYYPKATDSSNVQINNAIIPLAKGIDSKGVKNEIVIANETITGVTWEEGKNYLYKTDSGYGKSIHKPRYLKSELIRTYAGEQPDYFDVEKNKWFSCDAGSELVTNGTFSDGTTTGWTAVNSTLSIVNGTLEIVDSSPYNSGAYQYISTVIGKEYKLSFTTSGTREALLSIDDVYILQYDNHTYSGTYVGITIYKFIAQSNNTKIFLTTGSTSGQSDLYVDNITCFPTEITPVAEITESRNYMNHIVHADSQGNPLFVEELQKIKYENIVKADEFRGKNACTGYVLFDLTATPVAILDKTDNIRSVIRTATGKAKIIFDEMDNLGFTIGGSASSDVNDAYIFCMCEDAYIPRTLTSIDIKTGISGAYKATGAPTNCKYVSVQIFGGRN